MVAGFGYGMLYSLGLMHCQKWSVDKMDKKNTETHSPCAKYKLFSIEFVSQLFERSRRGRKRPEMVSCTSATIWWSFLRLYLLWLLWMNAEISLTNQSSNLGATTLNSRKNPLPPSSMVFDISLHPHFDKDDCPNYDLLFCCCCFSFSSKSFK